VNPPDAPDRTPWTQRSVACCMCGETLRIVACDKGSFPEMIQVPEGAWLGFVRGSETTDMIVACGQACLGKLLSGKPR
jgi:hypothetical protein